MCIECFETIPKISQGAAVCWAILNVVMPGIGTVIASTLDQPGFNRMQFWIGIGQFFMSFFLIGWVWSIWWGWLIIQRSDADYNVLPRDRRDDLDRNENGNGNGNGIIHGRENIA